MYYYLHLSRWWKKLQHPISDYFYVFVGSDKGQGPDKTLIYVFEIYLILKTFKVNTLETINDQKGQIQHILKNKTLTFLQILF